jgi:hypothetical protein
MRLICVISSSAAPDRLNGKLVAGTPKRENIGVHLLKREEWLHLARKLD